MPPFYEIVQTVECADCERVFESKHQLNYHTRHTCWQTPYSENQCLDPQGCDCKIKADMEDLTEDMFVLHL